MTTLQEMYASLGIDAQVLAFGEHILENLKDRFAAIDETAEYNQLKVIRAMQKARVSEACLLGTTGYGYNDIGRDTLEEVYANLFHAEDALVRPQITCGTHALALALAANLRPGDELLSPVGKPYDTLEEVISILEKNDTVTQIYRVTGKSRLHVHAVSPSQEELEQLLHGTMDHLPGVLECSTNIILSRVKDIKGLRL